VNQWRRLGVWVSERGNCVRRKLCEVVRELFRVLEGGGRASEGDWLGQLAEGWVGWSRLAWLVAAGLAGRGCSWLVGSGQLLFSTGGLVGWRVCGKMCAG